ncbi:hypothetical protein [Paenibacillus gansuensis]|uniref:Uncharacterized protein n=1 Tax=Paenibacillus gansuensis TaxID=306542 RepID=A0ABW5PJI8_9BACL
MKTPEPKEVCLLLNLGGFEMRMSENLELARSLGKTVYSLTGEGLVKVEGAMYLVPANVISMTPAELLVWSSKLNDQLQAEGFLTDDAVILAAGKKYRGTLPLGTTIGLGIRVGA